MLKLTKTSTITLPVTIRLPTDEAGKTNEGTINVRYHLLPKDQVVGMAREELSDREHIERTVVEISGFGDDDGQPITGEAALDEVLNGRWSGHLQSAIIEEYYAHFGQVRVKNSRPSRGR